MIQEKIMSETIKEAFDAAAELAMMDLSEEIGKTATELRNRLEACESHVLNETGEWKWDRVPSDLVMDLLGFLASLSASRLAQEKL